MLELVAVSVERLPLIFWTSPLDVDAIGIAGDDAARALHDVDSTVGPRVVAVVREVDRLAFRRANERHVDVAQNELFAPTRIVVWKVLRRVQPQAARVAAHGNEIIEPIAVIDVETLRDGSEPVCRIQVAVAPHRVGAAPEAFALGAELDPTKVVQISALGVQHLAEQAATNQIEDEHLPAVVAAVLHHD